MGNPIVEAKISELLEVRAVLDARIKSLQIGVETAEKATTAANLKPVDAGKPKEEPPNLDFIDGWLQSTFGDKTGQYMEKAIVPVWALKLTYPITTSKWKYYLSKNGNLTRYPNKNQAK